jgi:hypothetical protein
MPRSQRSDARAYLAALEVEAGTSSSVKAWLKFNELYGRTALSRRKFLEELQVQHKRTGAWGRWQLNGPQRAIEALRLRTVRAGLPERYAILKARKLGVSVYWIGALLAEVTRTKSLRAAIVGQHDDAAKKLLRQAKQVRDHAPWKLVKRFDNQKQLYFDSPLDSSIDLASAKSDDPLRGDTLRFVHCTEPQMWVGDPAAKRIAIEGCVVDEPDTLISYEGTGFGINWWHEFWWKAFEGREENGFQAIFLSWLLDAHFDYCVDVTPEQIEAMAGTLTPNEEELRRHGANWGQIAWRRQKLATMFAGDERLFAQEFPSTPQEAFLSDGRPAFLFEAVDRSRKRCVDPRWTCDLLLGERRHGEWGIDFKLIDDPRGALSIWEHPEPEGDYAIGCDTGYGMGLDNSVIHVINNNTRRQVAKFVSNRIEPHRFGHYLCALGEYYHRAYTLVEIEGAGRGVIEALKDLEYPMIGMRSTYDEHGKVVGRKLGFSTNIHTRELVFNAIRENLAEPKGVELCDVQTCQEMLPMFRDLDGKVKTPTGKKDDHVLGWGMALMAHKDSRNPVEPAVKHELPPGSLEDRHWREYERQVAEPEEASPEEWGVEWP